MMRSPLQITASIVNMRFILAANHFLAMMFIAQLGHVELAASALISSIYMFFMLFDWSTVLSISTYITRITAQKKDTQSDGVLGAGWLLGTIIAIPVMLILWNIDAILRFFQQPPAILELVTHYFHILVWGILPNVWFMAVTQSKIISRAQSPISKTKKMLTTLLKNAINTTIVLGLGYSLLFGHFGLPALGITGMAYAYVVMYWERFIVALWPLRHHCRDILRFHAKQYRHHLVALLDIALPTNLLFMLEYFIYAIAMLWMGHLSQISLAAQHIVVQFNLIEVVFPYSLGMAISLSIAKMANNQSGLDIRRIGFWGLRINVAFAIVVAIIYCLFAPFLISFYVDLNHPIHRETFAIAKQLLYLMAFTQIFDAIRISLLSALRGLKDLKMALFLESIFFFIPTLGISYFFAFYMGLGAIGIGIGFLIGFAINAATLVWRFYHITNMREGQRGHPVTPF